MVTGLLQERQGGLQTWGIRAALRSPILDLSLVNARGLQNHPVADSVARRGQKAGERLHNVVKSRMSPYGVICC